MSEREENVYKAKLAEQAERYDGKVSISNEIFFFCNKALLILMLDNVIIYERV